MSSHHQTTAKSAPSLVDTQGELKSFLEEDLPRYRNEFKRSSDLLDIIDETTAEGRKAVESHEKNITELRGKDKLLISLIKQHLGDIETVAWEVRFDKHTTQLEARNTELEARNTELEARNTELVTRNTELEASNTELMARNTELTTKVKSQEETIAKLEGGNGAPTLNKSDLPGLEDAPAGVTSNNNSTTSGDGDSAQDFPVNEVHLKTEGGGVISNGSGISPHDDDFEDETVAVHSSSGIKDAPAGGTSNNNSTTSGDSDSAQGFPVNEVHLKTEGGGVVSNGSEISPHDDDFDDDTVAVHSSSGSSPHNDDFDDNTVAAHSRNSVDGSKVTDSDGDDDQITEASVAAATARNSKRDVGNEVPAAGVGRNKSKNRKKKANSTTGGATASPKKKRDSIKFEPKFYKENKASPHRQWYALNFTQTAKTRKPLYAAMYAEAKHRDENLIVVPGTRPAGKIVDSTIPDPNGDAFDLKRDYSEEAFFSLMNGIIEDEFRRVRVQMTVDQQEKMFGTYWTNQVHREEVRSGRNVLKSSKLKYHCHFIRPKTSDLRETIVQVEANQRKKNDKRQEQKRKKREREKAGEEEDPTDDTSQRKRERKSGEDEEDSTDNTRAATA